MIAPSIKAVSEPVGESIQQWNGRSETAPFGWAVIVGQRFHDCVNDRVFVAGQQVAAGLGDVDHHSPTVFPITGPLHKRPSFKLAYDAGNCLRGNALPGRQRTRVRRTGSREVHQDRDLDKADPALSLIRVQLPQPPRYSADCHPQLLGGLHGRFLTGHVA